MCFSLFNIQNRIRKLESMSTSLESVLRFNFSEKIIERAAIQNITFFTKIPLMFAVLIILFSSLVTRAEEMLFENFTNNPQERREFITDTVMGGKSQGKVEFLTDNNDKFARMTGHVTLENNGGFIQFRRRVSRAFEKKRKGLRLKVRGNGESYFVHLRTSGTYLPWQYFQSKFFVEDDWGIVELPFTQFRRSGVLVFKNLLAEDVQSIGIVAFGKNHDVLIDVGSVVVY